MESGAFVAPIDGGEEPRFNTSLELCERMPEDVVHGDNLPVGGDHWYDDDEDDNTETCADDANSTLFVDNNEDI